jgi:hypothetical protein
MCTGGPCRRDAASVVLIELAESWNFLADEFERASVKEPDRNND